MRNFIPSRDFAIPTEINRNSPAAQGLIHCWMPWASRQARILLDVSRRNHATVVGAPTNVVNPALGTAIETTNNANYYTLSSVAVSTPYSISMWFSVATLSRVQWLISLRAANNYPVFGFIGNNRFITYCGGEKYMYSTKTWAAGDVDQIFNVTVSVDSSALSGWKVFINGIDDTGTKGNDSGDFFEPSATGSIAYDSFIGGLYWSGLIGPVLIYDRELTAADTWYLYDPATRWDLYQSSRRVRGRAPAAPAGQPMMLRATTVPGMRAWHPRIN